MRPLCGRTLVALASPLCLSLAPAGAQTAAPPEEIALPPIEVQAPRIAGPLLEIPAAVSVVGKADIQDGRQGLGLDESLSAVPGVFMQNRYNFAQDLRVSIRGFGARAAFGIRGVKIMVDGIPLTLPDGQGGVDSIDLNSAERIEVIRGPASSLYGNASGGVIRIQSERGPRTPFVEGGVQAGEFGLTEYTATTGGQAGPLNYHVSGSSLTYDGFREHSRTERDLINGRFETALPGDATLTAVATLVDSPVAEDPGALTPEQFNDDPSQARERNVTFDGGEQLDQQRFGLVYRQPLGRDHELRLRNYYLWREFANKLPFVDGGSVRFDRFFTGGGASYTYTGNLLGRRNRAVVGVDVEHQEDDRQRFNNNRGRLGALTFDQTEQVTTLGLFAQDELWLTPKWQLSAGIRYDRLEFDADDAFLADGDDSGDRTLDEISPRIGTLYALSPAANLYANVSTAFESPTTTEFANPDGGGFNPDLEPQTATNYELGLKGLLANALRYELVGFHIDVEDELLPFELAGEPDREFFRNAGESTRDGVEVALDWRPLRGLKTTLAYTYSDFEFDAFTADGQVFDGNTLPGSPEHVLRGEVFYRWDSGAFAGIDARYVDDQFADNANSERADGYMVANLRLGYKGEFGRWRVEPYAGVNNLLDEEYANNVRINAFGGRFIEPGPERNAYAGINVAYHFGQR